MGYLYCLWGFYANGRSSRDPYELSISSGPGEWSILDTVSCLQRRKLGDTFCGLSLRDTDFCVYLKGRNEGRKRIILVDFLLQIQISYLCRYLPPNSFHALHFFSWNPLFDFEFSESLLSCKFVSLYVYFYFFQEGISYATNFLCLISLNAWSFKVYPCDYRCHDSLISVVVF